MQAVRAQVKRLEIGDGEWPRGGTVKSARICSGEVSNKTAEETQRGDHGRLRVFAAECGPMAEYVHCLESAPIT